MIYFIQSPSLGHIKIGFTEGPMNIRINALQCEYKEKLNLLIVARGTKAFEAEIHRRFESFRIIGEWFSPAIEIIDFYKTLKPVNSDEFHIPITPISIPAKLRTRLYAIADANGRKLTKHILMVLQDHVDAESVRK